MSADQYRREVRYTEWAIGQIEGPQTADALRAILEDAYDPARQATRVTFELTNLDDRREYPCITVRAEYGNGQD